MKIVVIGTSNSIIGRNGFIKALQYEHEVISLSLGRTPFFYHIVTIIKNKELIESCDLLLIDHYVNDQFYLYNFSERYLRLYELFYKYLSSLNVRIVNIMLPVVKSFRRITPEHRNFIKSLASTYSISCIDLNDYDFDKKYFRDVTHLTEDASYVFGFALSAQLTESKLGVKPVDGNCEQMPFRVVDLTILGGDNKSNKLSNFKNSILDIMCLDLKEVINIHASKTSRLLSIGYARHKNNKANSGVTINNHPFAFGGYGVYHEAIDENVSIHGDIALQPILTEYGEYKTLMGRGGISKGIFAYCHLTDLLFYDEAIVFKLQSASRKVIELNFNGIVPMLERIESMKAQSIEDWKNNHISYVFENIFSQSWGAKKTILFSYFSYRILSKITWGKRKQHYKKKKQEFKALLKV